MGKPVLLLRLEGPLQSWGARARWDVRDTQPEPTKSGVMGLLGCALGYPMGDPRLEDLDCGLRMGVRVESPGEVMEDFNTVTDFLPRADGKYTGRGVESSSLAKLQGNPDAVPATIISPRFYLQDAAFLVALEETREVPGLLERCAEALRDPVWPVFLGRKACIATRPVLEALTEEYADISEALRFHPWEWRAMPRRLARNAKWLPKALAIHIEDTDGGMTRQDRIRVNPTRQYGFRQVRAGSVSLSEAVPKGGTP